MVSHTRSTVKHSPVDVDRSISSDAFAEILHELCVPLSSVGTAVDQLLKEADTIDSREATRTLLHRVRDGTRWLQDLVYNFASDPSGVWSEADLPLHMEPFNLAHSLERAIRVCAPLFEARAQTLRVDIPSRPVLVWGNEHLIRRVMLNLLSNAAKYAPTEDEVHVTLRSESVDVYVEVLDHGAALANRDLDRIFEPRVRGVSAHSRVPGWGLGLSIAKSLIERHGGGVGAHVGGPDGTLFWFRLPRLGDPHTRVRALPQRPSNKRSLAVALSPEQ